jgi:hypothetical protein
VFFSDPIDQNNVKQDGRHGPSSGRSPLRLLTAGASGLITAVVDTSLPFDDQFCSDVQRGNQINSRKLVRFSFVVTTGIDVGSWH